MILYIDQTDNENDKMYVSLNIARIPNVPNCIDSEAQ